VTPVRRALVFALLSLLLGGLAADTVGRREAQIESSIGAPVAVLVTARALDVGVRITAGDLAVRQVPKRWAPVGAVAKVSLAIGSEAAVALPAGAYLTAGSLRGDEPDATASLQPGERVATVVAAAPPGAIRVGALVDVVVATAGRRPLIAIRAAEVLAFRRPASDADSSAGRSSVEVDLRSSVGGALKLAQAEGDGSEVQLLPIGSAAR
jgi:Flp pilus assembly protein CpaB